MALSTAVMKELQAELTGIEGEITTLQERADAIRKVLGESPQLVVRWTAPRHGAIVRPQVIPQQYEGMTLRQVVSTKLKAHPGWKSADVTQALRKEGYSRGGSTRFSHRIYNEIWRMEKDGLVARDAKGGFVLKEAS
jgi:hypothetical protein